MVTLSNLQDDRHCRDQYFFVSQDRTLQSFTFTHTCDAGPVRFLWLIAYVLRSVPKDTQQSVITMRERSSNQRLLLPP